MTNKWQLLNAIYEENENLYLIVFIIFTIYTLNYIRINTMTKFSKMVLIMCQLRVSFITLYFSNIQFTDNFCSNS